MSSIDGVVNKRKGCNAFLSSRDLMAVYMVCRTPKKNPGGPSNTHFRSVLLRKKWDIGLVRGVPFW